jgi:hypothetical protein
VSLEGRFEPARLMRFGGQDVQESAVRMARIHTYKYIRRYY